MRILLTFIFVLNCFFGFSQKPLTLIIDTVDFIDNYDKYYFKVNLTNQGFADLGEIDTTAKVSTEEYPNFQTTVNLKTDSTNIQIPIDQQHGFLELSNVYNQDTIRINYLKLYSNCYKDTSKTVIEYYRIINDSIADKPHKVKRKTRTHKEKCERKPPFKTALTINEERYFVSVQKKKSDALVYTHGHGYKPTRYYENREDFKGKATKLYISTWTTEYLNWITIRLK